MRNRIAILAIAVGCISPALALDPPARKPGLWELKTQIEGKSTASQVMKQCVDAQTDAQMQAFGTSMGAKLCSEREVRREGDSIVSDAVCRIGPITMRTHSVTTGDFNSAYTTNTTSKQESGPTIAGMGGSNTTIAARWTGPCEEGQRPGDIILANGVKMNVNDLKKLMPGNGGSALPR